MGGTVAFAFSALWLSAVIFWPLDAARGQMLDRDPRAFLRDPLVAIVACAALAFVSLPIAALVLRAAARRTTSAELRAELATQDERVRGHEAESK